MLIEEIGGLVNQCTVEVFDNHDIPRCQRGVHKVTVSVRSRWVLEARGSDESFSKFSMVEMLEGCSG